MLKEDVIAMFLFTTSLYYDIGLFLRVFAGMVTQLGQIFRYSPVYLKNTL